MGERWKGARRGSNQRPASCSREHCGKGRQKKRRNGRRETGTMARGRKRRSNEKRRVVSVDPTAQTSHRGFRKTLMAPTRIRKR